VSGDEGDHPVALVTSTSKPRALPRDRSDQPSGVLEAWRSRSSAGSEATSAGANCLINAVDRLHPASLPCHGSTRPRARPRVRADRNAVQMARLDLEIHATGAPGCATLVFPHLLEPFPMPSPTHHRDSPDRRRADATVARRAAFGRLVGDRSTSRCRSPSRRDELVAAIRDHQVVVVAGETGSGKSTQLPSCASSSGAASTA
jgi:hypothetical protein